MRCGGITGFIEVAEILEKYPIKLCNHLLPELSINLMAAFKNSYYLEFDDMLPKDIFVQSININYGYAITSSTIGTGVELNAHIKENFKIRG